MLIPPDTRVLHPPQHTPHFSARKHILSHMFSYSACHQPTDCCTDGISTCGAADGSLIPSYGDDDDICFSGDSTVQLASGATKTMADLEVGDSILSADASGKLSYSIRSRRSPPFCSRGKSPWSAVQGPEAPPPFAKICR